MSLLIEFDKIFNDRAKWCYYSGYWHYSANPFETGSFKCFIDTYFQYGDKSTAFSFLEQLGISITEERYTHMVATYFLGIYLAKVFFASAELDINGDKDFRWLWFLLCLYHDIGYAFEENRREFCAINTYDKIINDKRIKIKHIFYEKLDNPIYPQDLIANYFNYCISELGFLNHGIIGGLLLYDRLKKICFEACKKYCDQNNMMFIEGGSFVYNNRRWAENDLKIFAHLADIIVAHNIWKASRDSISLYKQYDLHGLIDVKVEPPTGLYDKLFYLLCICDTIEPTKNFRKNYKITLDSIDIKIKEEIEISTTLEESSRLSWFNKIQDLNDWLSVSVEKRDSILSLQID